MRATYRVVRVLLGFVLLALSVGWLLRRRRAPDGPPATGRRLSVVPPVSSVDETVEPRAPEPLTALGRPVHDGPPGLAEPAAAGPATAAPAWIEPTGTGPAAELAAPAAPAADAGMADRGGDGVGVPAGAGAGNGAVAVSDDLREIRGIGPATESALHELGIHTYRQLAVLDADGRAQLRAALRDSRQRIEREDWVGQAAELHRAKYGEDPLQSV